MRQIIPLALLALCAPFCIQAQTHRAAASAPKAGPMRLVVQLGHRSFVYGFAVFSKDGRLVATGASGDVVLWDVLTGREVRRFAGNEGDPGAQDVDGWLWGAFSPDERGEFFLLAYDTGTADGMKETLQRAISSEELGAWLRDVDAGELVMVVDACHSAASVQGEGFKPGPMGSRGLGQLAYDKGMRILTSTQADDVALESHLVEQGLLTYALTREAVESWQADALPHDNRITVAEWLGYGTARVPALHAEVEKRLAEMQSGEKAAGASVLGDDEKTRVVVLARGGPQNSNGRGLTVSGQSGRAQQPALFDFARRRRDSVLVSRL